MWKTFLRWLGTTLLRAAAEKAVEKAAAKPARP